MKIFLNEWDNYAASWLRSLSNGGEIPKCEVCEKSITDLSPSDLKDFDQCHFSLALGVAVVFKMGWNGFYTWCMDRITPCQPFSVAGKKEGIKDERHLAPVWFELIKSQKPSAIFGEQVSSAISHGWIDELFRLLEGEGYSCAFAVLPGYVVGAPHKRDRIFFGATKVADARKVYGTWKQHRESRQRKGDEPKKLQIGPSDFVSGFDQWEDYEVHTSEYDYKNRICKPRIPLLVNGIPGTMGAISGYGNALIPQVGAFFIENFMHSVGDMISE